MIYYSLRPRSMGFTFHVRTLSVLERPQIEALPCPPQKLTDGQVNFEGC